MARYELTEAEREVTGLIIGASIEVHRHFRAGLLESTYEECLSLECAERNLKVERQKPQPVFYKGLKLSTGYRVDLIINELILVELKTVDKFHPIHTAQVLTYLSLTGLRVGLLLNFNTLLMRDGIKRVVLSPDGFGSASLISEKH
jgi:GxxExxY protein